MEIKKMAMKIKRAKILVGEGDGPSAGWVFIRHYLPTGNIEGIAIRHELVKELYEQLKPYIEDEND